MVIVLVIVLLVSIGRNNALYSDEEYYQMPRLFQLDDYQQCLSRSEGLYCLGTFHITHVGGANAIYDFIKKYSSEAHHYNRSLIHRGYCVSSRCPELNGSYATRFQLCAERINRQLLQTTDLPGRVQTADQSGRMQTTDQSGRMQTADQPGRVQTADQSGRVQTSLIELQYCHTSVEIHEKVPLNTAKLVFLVVVCVVVLLNLIGTVYDVRSKKAMKIRLLTVWSVQKNWKKLTSYHKKAVNSSLGALHGIKVAITICLCLGHSTLLHFMSYTYNPRTVEHMISHPLSMLIQNSTEVEQMMFVISGFLLARQLQQRTGDQPPGARAAAFLIAKRIFRLLPVFALVVGFAASWWPALSGGPLWASVAAESSVCQNKFWTHVLFINNLVEPGRLCLLSTWYMAVDFQLHVVFTIILVVLMQLRIPKLPVLVVIFVGSALLNAVLAYAFNWSPMMYLTTSPEKLRTLFRDEPSFAGLYMSPWGNMPACVLGLIAGHLYNEARAGDWDFKRFKWLVTPICVISVPAMLAWIVAGYWLQRVTGRLFVVSYAAIERSIFQICCLLSFVVTCAVCGFLIRFLSWRGWHVMSRMSYPVMLLHWLVNFYIMASSPQPLTTSIFEIVAHGFITAFFSFLLAIPVTVLVEMPIKELFDVITSTLE